MTRRMLIAIALLALLASPAMAQPGVVSSIGPRVGFSVDPDQFVFGGQIAVGPIAPSLMFVPGIDIGVGDNETVVSGNFDLHYHLATRATWSPYLGAGMGIHNETLERQFGDDLTETNVGGNLLFGVTAPTSSGSRFFTELKLGLGDGPSMKMMAGWNFRM